MSSMRGASTKPREEVGERYNIRLVTRCDDDFSQGSRQRAVAPLFNMVNAKAESGKLGQAIS